MTAYEGIKAVLKYTEFFVYCCHLSCSVDSIHLLLLTDGSIDADVGAKVIVAPRVHATLGSTVSLSCKAVLYKTPLSVLEWAEGGVAASSKNGRVNISGPALPKLKLTIANFELSDVGDYTCSLRTAQNETVSATTTVTLKGVHTHITLCVDCTMPKLML